MKMYLLVFLFFIVSCQDAKQAQAPHEPFVNTVIQPIQNMRGLETVPDSLVVFLWPDKLDWETAHYPNNLDYFEKLAIVTKNVQSLSKKHDQLDREMFVLTQELSQILKAIDQKNETVGTLEAEQTDLDCANTTINQERCQEIENELLRLQSEITSLQTRGDEIDFDLLPILNQKKTDIIEATQNFVDRDRTNPQNWLVALDDKQETSLDFSGDRPRISLRKFGVDKLDYSTEDGTLTVKEFIPGKKLDLILKNKSACGEYKECTIEFEFDIGVFLNRVRLQGDLIVKNLKGEVIRRGVAKMEVAIL